MTTRRFDLTNQRIPEDATLFKRTNKNTEDGGASDEIENFVDDVKDNKFNSVVILQEIPKVRSHNLTNACHLNVPIFVQFPLQTFAYACINF